MLNKIRMITAIVLVRDDLQNASVSVSMVYEKKAGSVTKRKLIAVILKMKIAKKMIKHQLRSDKTCVSDGFEAFEPFPIETEDLLC